MLVEFEGRIWESVPAIDGVPRHDGVVRHRPPDHLWLSTGRRHAGDLETPLPEVIRSQVLGRNLLEKSFQGVVESGPSPSNKESCGFWGKLLPPRKRAQLETTPYDLRPVKTLVRVPCTPHAQGLECQRLIS